MLFVPYFIKALKVSKNVLLTSCVRSQSYEELISWTIDNNSEMQERLQLKIIAHVYMKFCGPSKFVLFLGYSGIKPYLTKKELKFSVNFLWTFFYDFKIFSGDYPTEERSVRKTLPWTQYEYLICAIKCFSSNLGLVKLVEITSKSLSFQKCKFRKIRQLLAT